MRLVQQINNYTSITYKDRSVLIVFNKIDLYDEKAMAILSEYEQSYKKANYSTLNTSLVNQTGINEFKQIIYNLL